MVWRGNEESLSENTVLYDKPQVLAKSVSKCLEVEFAYT